MRLPVLVLLAALVHAGEWVPVEVTATAYPERSGPTNDAASKPGVDNTKSTRPFVVVLLRDVRETVGFRPGVMTTQESFTKHTVGRYRKESDAETAAVRSARRHGGWAYSLRGPLIHEPFPVPRRQANPADQLAGASPAQLRPVVGRQSEDA